MSMFENGQKYFIRTATNYVVGKLVEQDDKFLKLEDASWVADTGRFGAAMATGKFNEVEPFAKPVRVSLGAIVDATEYLGELPLKTK